MIDRLGLVVPSVFHTNSLPWDANFIMKRFFFTIATLAMAFHGTPSSACATCGLPTPSPPPAITNNGGAGGMGGQGGAGGMGGQGGTGGRGGDGGHSTSASSATALGVGNGGDSYARGGAANVTVLSLPSLPSPFPATGVPSESFRWEQGDVRLEAVCPVPVFNAGLVGGRAPYGSSADSSWYVSGGLSFTVPMGTVNCAAVQKQQQNRASAPPAAK
jgi:hypothetical protein